ncbi:MAG TPA: glycosyltransferase [Gaiellaceae bacterium]|nr:glycosyltransferase [Gaiellaceae bacterium]
MGAAAAETAPVSVVIPTIGRAPLLAKCLASLALCSPRAAEIIVVDQSGEGEIHAAVEAFAGVGARSLHCAVRDRSIAVNEGMAAAEHEFVLVTDDDCTVAETWVETAAAHLLAEPEAIVTGRVLPVGDAIAIPSLVGAAESSEYSGSLRYDVLFGCNMACSRDRFLELGGFDERVQLAEDNDFCYRWLRAGRRLRYDPELLVWHHAWRTPAQLRRHFHGYARGQGIFYAKHLLGGDLAVIRFLARDVYRASRAAAALVLRGRGEWPDARLALIHGVPTGFAVGWRAFRGRRDAETHG